MGKPDDNNTGENWVCGGKTKEEMGYMWKGTQESVKKKKSGCPGKLNPAFLSPEQVKR